MTRDIDKSLDDIWGVPYYDEEKEARLCRVCGEPAGKYDSRLRRYCSYRCKRIAYAVQAMFTWETVRKKVMKRDDYTCQKCGERLPETELVVHHITSLSEGGHPFDEKNLETLCHSCHGEKHGEIEREPKEEDIIPLTEYIKDVEIKKE